VRDIFLRDKQGEPIGKVIRHEFMEDGVTLKLDTALENIRDEMADDYEAGKVRPFVEGEPIGVIHNQKRGPAKMLKTEAELYAERQKVLRELRVKNDEAMNTILKRRK